MKYIVTSNTNVIRKSTITNDIFRDPIVHIPGFEQTKIVRQVNKGEIIDIAKTGSDGSGIIATPYLYFANGDYIIGYYANPYDEDLLVAANNDSLNILLGEGGKASLKGFFQDIINWGIGIPTQTYIIAIVVIIVLVLIFKKKK